MTIIILNKGIKPSSNLISDTDRLSINKYNEPNVYDLKIKSP